jgi:RimJ/RimL family protein N-acetyltransferase
VSNDPNSWYAMPRLSGDLVVLEPLAAEHAPGYLAAAGAGSDAEEVFRWLTSLAPPRDLDDAAAQVTAALAARARGERLPYAQLDARSGEFIGTTSYYEVNPAARAIAIGHTWLGRRWWRTGHNTESKLLLLTHAFDALGAARVVWHTDVLNTRSRAAIERLGATREGQFRKHRIRLDGSWRDTVQYAMTDDDWPGVRQALTERLVQGRRQPA